MIAAVIQARMASTRLPGKVLKKISNKSLLELQIERIKLSNKIQNIIVATSINEKDDEIEKFCLENKIIFYRGPEKDVLARYYECAKLHNIKTIVRLTADCPLIDPKTIDKVIELFAESNVDYSSNTVPPETSFWPDGSDVEVFSFDALEKAFKGARNDDEREHVTFFFWKNKLSGFKTSQLKNINNWSKYRYTVDYSEDFEAIKFLYREIKKRKIFGHVHEIIDILDNNPKISILNKKYHFGIGWENGD